MRVLRIAGAPRLKVFFVPVPVSVAICKETGKKKPKHQAAVTAVVIRRVVFATGDFDGYGLVNSRTAKRRTGVIVFHLYITVLIIVFRKKSY